MADGTIHIDDFLATQRRHLEEANRTIARNLVSGNITCAVDGLEFVIPVRETVVEGKTELFVRLAGKMEPSDRLFRLRMAPRFRVESIVHHKSKPD